MSEQPTVAAEIREEQKKVLKEMSFKEKVIYFWDYYKVHVLVIIVTVAIVAGLAHDIINAKDYCFYAMMINSYNLDSAAVSDGFAGFANLDTETYNCYIDTASTLDPDSLSEYDVATSQVIMAVVQNSDLDAMVSDAGVFYKYAQSEMFLDLRDIYTEEELASYADNLYYVDAAAIAAANEDTLLTLDDLDTAPMTDAELDAKTEGSRHPEKMKDPVPVGIFINGAPFITESGCYSEQQPVIFGIIANTLRPETAKDYLQFLWTSPDPDANYNSQ